MKKIKELNADKTWVNSDLYRLMFKPDYYVIAYEKIKSKPGNLAKGTDGKNIDGFSLKTIEGIIKEMRDESFKFSPARRVLIPKPNGKTRALGIATTRDKVVQEVIKNILETIYEDTFSEKSHGFRPNLGCHTALKNIRNEWSGVTWIIEGDIKGFFDNIDHNILINILRKRINDERFINLIRKALNAGFMISKEFKNSLVGTPQGSIVSPILANIYLNEFDEFVNEKIIKEMERGVDKKNRKINPEHRRISRKISTLEDKLEDKSLDRLKLVKEIKSLRNQLFNTPAADQNDKDYVRIKYVRYADDWCIGVNGSKADAEAIKQACAEFLDEKLNLELSLEKTTIIHAKTERAFFLGTIIHVGTKKPKIAKVLRNGKVFYKRVAGWTPIMEAPIDKLVKKLVETGFCHPDGNPKCCNKYILLDDNQIVDYFSSVMNGIINYYSFVDNYVDLRRIQYILQYSAAKTLAGKHRSSVAKVFKKYGNNLKVKIKDENNVITNETALKLVRIWDKNVTRFMTGKCTISYDGKMQLYMRMRTKSKLFSNCCICGETENIVMHHVKHVRKVGEKLKGFTKLMSTLNRKQIPVCENCHLKIHNGEYDGISLSQFKLSYVAEA